MTPSHRLKLQRAEKHLIDLEDMLKGVRDRKEYPVRETVNAKRQHVYKLDLSGITLDERLPIVLGDALFNTHSALDHLIVAIAPNNRKSSAGFPIYPDDPLARDETTGDYLNLDASRKWQSMTKGLPSDCVAVLKSLQPHAGPKRWGEGTPADHPLAILSALHNADKHRNLVAVVTALADPEARIDGEWSHMAHPVPNAALQGDAVIHRSKRPVDVYVEGSAVIAVGRPDEVRELGHVIEAITKYIGSAVLPELEKFL